MYRKSQAPAKNGQTRADAIERARILARMARREDRELSRMLAAYAGTDAATIGREYQS